MNRTALAVLPAIVAVCLHATAARAQMAHVPDNDWRQPDRHDSLQRAAQPANFTVEMRFGPYLPGIDAHAPGGATPFADVFGRDCSVTPSVKSGSVKQQLIGGFEIDYTPLRVPYVGALGLGLGWSFTSFSNQAQITNGDACSSETTSLQIMPMHASVVFRADELMRRTGIPLVPYGKVGVGLAWWRSANDSGTERVCGTASAPAACNGADGETVVASGTGLTPSMHFAVGLALSINFLQPQSAARLEQTTGVHHAYVFGEYYNDTLTLAQNVLHVGAQSWVAGLSIDF